jgi:outer membrane protein assembly factor BamB
MYNRDVAGWRFNPAERTLSPATVGRLEERWRFPPRGANFEIGAVHATPAIVDGEVYFGTATEPTFFKLSSRGELLWQFRADAGPSRTPPASEPRPADVTDKLRAESIATGILASPLVHGQTVYFADIGGRIFALDRATGTQRWKLNTRGRGFPGAHPLNAVFASPIPAAGRIIVAGGAIEQLVAGTSFYRGSTGRGFVLALDPATGELAWKFDLGPPPQPLDPPVVIQDSWGAHKFHFGPATSTIWSTPSFDAESETIYFGTDVNTAPRQPTADNPRLHTAESCAIVALAARDGSVRWITQLHPEDVWTNAMRTYNPESGRYKDQSIGDTPKLFVLPLDGRPTKVLGVGCKDGGFYLLRADDGRLVAKTPTYTGPPAYPLTPPPDPRMLALPSAIGGLQTGCATDGRALFTNGIDALLMGSQAAAARSAVPPTGGRVVSLSLDLAREYWRHERPPVASLGGPPPKPVYQNVGDPVASGLALANGVVYCTTVASGKLLALDAASGRLLKEFDLGPVWAGPAVSRGRVYVGSGNTLLSTADYEAYFPKRLTGTVYSFGLPGND